MVLLPCQVLFAALFCCQVAHHSAHQPGQARTGQAHRTGGCYWRLAGLAAGFLAQNRVPRTVDRVAQSQDPAQGSLDKDVEFLKALAPARGETMARSRVLKALLRAVVSERETGR